MEETKQREEFSIYDDSTRVVVMRDYATSVMITKFDEDAYPKQIEEKNISREDFQRTIRKINSYFEDAETLDSTTLFEGIVGCLTFYTLFLCYDNKYKKILRQLDEYLHQENERLYLKHNLEILNPLANGLLELEIKVLQDSDSV